MTEEKTISSLEISRAINYPKGHTHTAFLTKVRNAFFVLGVPEYKYKSCYGGVDGIRTKVCYNLPEKVAVYAAGNKSDIVKLLYNPLQQPLLNVAMQLTGYQTANKLNEGQEDMKNALTTISTQPKKETQMNVMTTMNNAPVKTMSSIEIVAVINAMRPEDKAVLRHSDFMVKLEKHPGIDSPKFFGQYKDSTGRTLKCYNLPEREAKLMVMSESLEVQTAVLDRLIEIEGRIKPVDVNLNDPSTLRTYLLSYTEKVIELQATIIKQAPKVAFHDAVAVADNCQTWDEVARVIGVGKMKMLKELREREIIMKSNLPYQRCINAGYFEVVETTFTDGKGVAHISAKVLVTGKGVIYISKLFN